MRCYFLRESYIVGVAMLPPGLSVRRNLARIGHWRGRLLKYRATLGERNHARRRGLPGGAEGIRTSDLRTQAPLLPVSAFTVSCGDPIRKNGESRAPRLSRTVG
jgi:hypothetical protein